MGRRYLDEFWEGLGDPRGGPGWVGGISMSFGKGWGTLGEVHDGSMVSRGGLGQVWGISVK